MMCDERLWGTFPAAVQRDVRHALPIGVTISEMASTILKGAPTHFALAGLSLGGIVAMEILAQAPERVERLALLDTNPLAETPSRQAARLPQIERVYRQGLEPIMRREILPNYLHSKSDRSDLWDLCVEMAVSLGPDVFKSQSLALRDREDRQAALAAFRKPALVLTGEDDRLCPLEKHELMHGLMPQAYLEVVSGAGHLPPLERPMETTNALLSWLEEL